MLSGHTLQVEDRVDGDIDGDEEVGVQKSQLCLEPCLHKYSWVT